MKRNWKEYIVLTKSWYSMPGFGMEPYRMITVVKNDELRADGVELTKDEVEAIMELCIFPEDEGEELMERVVGPGKRLIMDPLSIALFDMTQGCVRMGDKHGADMYQCLMLKLYPDLCDRAVKMMTQS